MTAKILLVEDLGLACRGVRQIFESAGYEVVEAEDGLSALERYLLEKPDVVLLDVIMKDMNGACGFVTRPVEWAGILKAVAGALEAPR
jgi:CheY-like chemotaxis protein